MIRKIFIVLFFWSMSCLVVRADANNQYAGIARISYLSGHVGFQHAGDADWSAASINLPLQVGDRIYTSEDGRAEIQFDDGSAYRLAEKTDVEFLTLNDDLTQIRMLVGLSTLIVNSGMGYEIDTPAAAFTTLQKGKYRFDVVENGDTDGIVRKGLLEASSNSFSRTVREGELLHIAAGGQSEGTMSSYRERDGWDEWNDRRDADMAVYARSKYLPDNIYVGVRDLDLYGRWIVSPYGPAWVPLRVGVSWSPYWNGRWCYRPIWGWTWVSYEPWGWLPFHYGRWYYAASYGWCWIPGTAITFNFWSPGLVRFYYGPDWISWCPLGPGDYYNVNNYYYRTSHFYQLNNIRLTQNRAPGNLINRDAPRAFRTVKNDQFVRLSYGPGGSNGVDRIAVVDNPWKSGKIVDNRLNIRPTASSYSPSPDIRVSRPAPGLTRSVIVRSEPSVGTDSGRNIVRITNRNAGSPREIRSDAASAPNRNSSDSGAIVVRSIEAEKGASQNSARKSSAGLGTGSSGAMNPRSVQDRNENGNATRVFQVPQRQSTASAPGEVKGGTSAKEPVEQGIQQERNPARRTNTPTVNPTPSTNKRATPASENKVEKLQNKSTSDLMISPTSPSATRSSGSSAGTNASANRSGESFAVRRSSQSQSRSFSTQVQEQRQTWTGNNQGTNRNSTGAASNSGVRQYSSPAASRSSFSSSAGAARTSANAARSASQNARSSRSSAAQTRQKNK